ncbi:MAG: hypothetical protein KDA80_01685 [Planctomycetaceae bacterium]|nr:hypothetical protein [Planctomycetaceae bacterium]
MKVLIRLSLLMFLGSGCQCFWLTEAYQDRIDRVADYEPHYERFYKPTWDLTRIGYPDWCHSKSNRWWCGKDCRACQYPPPVFYPNAIYPGDELAGPVRPMAPPTDEQDNNSSSADLEENAPSVPAAVSPESELHSLENLPAPAPMPLEVGGLDKAKGPVPMPDLPPAPQNPMNAPAATAPIVEDSPVEQMVFEFHPQTVILQHQSTEAFWASAKKRQPVPAAQPTNLEKPSTRDPQAAVAPPDGFQQGSTEKSVRQTAVEQVTFEQPSETSPWKTVSMDESAVSEVSPPAPSAGSAKNAAVSGSGASVIQAPANIPAVPEWVRSPRVSGAQP